MMHWLILAFPSLPDRPSPLHSLETNRFRRVSLSVGLGLWVIGDQGGPRSPGQ